MSPLDLGDSHTCVRDQTRVLLRGHGAHRSIVSDILTFQVTSRCLVAHSGRLPSSLQPKTVISQQKNTIGIKFGSERRARNCPQRFPTGTTWAGQVTVAIWLFQLAAVKVLRCRCTM